MSVDIFEGIKRRQEADRKRQIDNMKTDYTPFYDKSLTEYIESEIQIALKKMTQFRFIISKGGEPGIGKTAAVYRQASRLGWQIKQFDALTVFDDKLKEDLKIIVTSVNTPSVVLLFDNIEEIMFPDWFLPTKEQLEDKQRKKNTFIEVASSMYKQANFTIIATATEYWRAPRMLDKFFLTIKAPSPNLHVFRAIAKKHGLRLPTGFPKDIRQLHYFLRYNGVYTPYNSYENNFNKFRSFLTSYPRTEDFSKMKPPLMSWLLHNMFNNRYLLEKHKSIFYETMAIVCLADKYDDEKMLMALPKIDIMWDNPIFYPSK